MTTPMPRVPTPPARRLVAAVAAILIAAALANAALLAASLVVPASKAAKFYERDALQQGGEMLRRLGVVAAAWLLASLVGLAFRRKLAAGLREVWLDRGDLFEWTRRTFTRTDLLVCAGLVVLAAALRVPWVGAAVRFDETTTYVFFAARGPVKAWATYGTNNHVLHNVLMAVTSKFFGATPWGLRLPTLVYGSLLPALTYLAGRSLVREGDERPTAISLAGLLAGGAAAVGAYFVFFSVNARGYMMLLCFVMPCLIAAPMLRRGNAAAGLLFAASAAMGMATIPVMVYPLAGVGAWLLLSTLWRQGEAAPDEGRVLRVGALSAAAAVGATLAFYTPIMISAGYTVWFHNEMTLPKPRGEFVREFVPWLGYLWREWAVSPRWLGWPILLLAAVGVVAGRRRVRPSLLLVAAAVWAAMLLGQTLFPFPRVMLPLLALVLLSAGAGLARLAELVPKGRAAAALLTLAAMTLAAVATTRGAADLSETGVSRDADRLAADLRDRAGPGDAILSSYLGSRPLMFYFRRDGFPKTDWFMDPPPDAAALAGRRVWLALDENAKLPAALDYLGLDPASAASWRVVETYPHGGQLLRRDP